MLTRTATALGAALVAMALLLAVGSIWLVLTDPVCVADAVGDRGAQGGVEALARMIVQALERMVRCL